MKQEEHQIKETIQRICAALSELDTTTYLTVEFGWSTLNDTLKFSIMSGKCRRAKEPYPIYEALIFYNPRRITQWINAVEGSEFILADFLEMVDYLVKKYPKRNAEKNHPE